MGWFRPSEVVKEVRVFATNHDDGSIMSMYLAPPDMTFAEICARLPKLTSVHPYVANMRVVEVSELTRSRNYRTAIVTWHRVRYVQKPSMEVVWEVC